MRRELKKIGIILYIIPALFACSANHSSLKSKICSKTSFASNSAEQCICKLDVLESNFGHSVLIDLDEALEQNDVSKFEAQMISLAVEHPNKARLTSEQQSALCR